MTSRSLERAEVGRHNPLEAASLAGLIGILVAFVLVSWSYIRAEDARKDEAKRRRLPTSATKLAKKAERWGRYRSNIDTATGAMQLQNSGAARSALEDAPAEHRNWEWRHLHSQLDGPSLALPVPGGKVEALVLSPSGREIAVRCFNHNEVYLYEVTTGKEIAVLRGHTAPATSVAYRPDGRQVATASNDQTIRLWDPATGQQTTLLKAESRPVDRDPSWRPTRTASDASYSPQGGRHRPVGDAGRRRCPRDVAGGLPPLAFSPGQGWRDFGSSPPANLLAGRLPSWALISGHPPA